MWFPFHTKSRCCTDCAYCVKDICEREHLRHSQRWMQHWMLVTTGHDSVKIRVQSFTNHKLCWTRQKDISNLVQLEMCIWALCKCTSITTLDGQHEIWLPQMDLHRKPNVQWSVPLERRTALMASSGIHLLPFPMPISSITVVMNLMILLGTTSMLQQWCWTQDLPFPEAQRPRT